MTTDCILDEAHDLIGYFYDLEDKEEPGYTLNVGYFRSSTYRMIIMELHLAIESVLHDILYDALPKRRVFTAQQNRSFVDALSFSTAVDLAARFGILNRKGYQELLRLNKIRNRCAHDWILGQYKVTRGRRAGSGRRQYKVDFDGKDLFKPDVFKHEFLPHYGDFYQELFAVANGLRHKRQYTYYS
jgi:hypothetical protein